MQVPPIFQFLDRVMLVYDTIYRVMHFVCKLLLVFVVLTTVISVTGRYVPFVRNPVWSEELTLTGMAYMTVLSATLAIHKKTHIRMLAFDKYMHENVKIALDILADIAVMALGVIMLVFGWRFAVQMLRSMYVSMPISRFWMYLPVPLAGFAMIVFQIESLYKSVRRIFVKEEAV